MRSLAFALVCAVSLVIPTDAHSQQHADLQEMAEALNQETPFAVDEITKMMGATVTGRSTIQFRYSLFKLYLDEDNRDAINDYLKGNLTTAVTNMNCTDPEIRELIEAGVRIRHNYHDALMIHLGIIEVDARKCRRVWRRGGR